MKASTLFSLLALLSSACGSSLAFPPPPLGLQKPVQQEVLGLHEKNGRVQTVAVACHPDFMEITVNADLFDIGTPINPEELRLGVVHSHACSAVASSPEKYTIVAGLSDCGTKHWMTESSLVYTNLLIFSPTMSEDGLIRMDEAVIPIECHYERKYSLSSSSLQPTWIPFEATQSAVETLDFNFRIMTSDWLHERSSNVFYLSEPICIEASVRVANHMDLRVFMSSCVATLYPDRESTPRYDFIENEGCLVDSQLQGAHSQFLPRTQDNKLRLVIDAFRFYQEERGELYITCQLTATPMGSPTFYGSQWRGGMASKMNINSKTDKGLVPQNLLPTLEPSAHKDLPKEKNATSKQAENDEEASGEDELAGTSFDTTVDVAQKAPAKPNVPSAAEELGTPVSDLPETTERANVTVAPQQTVDPKPPVVMPPKK
ncbi:hypothetical protein NHX12_031198 [Muraenolepis orangiensis]|uniref:Zona pellucida sperm-binding protein 3 n=1 Tax=Muraenolepis orangiensis TaxID=630683 RepID=A0A9Q0E951_9TELE|nr:hypothetical protein NHX12_031198 [Muraenolepis orangiensis]